MGHCYARFFSSRIATTKAIKKLDNVARLLKSMSQRYEAQIAAVVLDPSTMNRPQLMEALRRKKLVEHSLKAVQRKMSVCLEKRLLLESLEVTKLQLKALQKSRRALKDFLTVHDQDKIEQLTSQLEDMSQNVMDIGDLMGPDAEADAELNAELDDEVLAKELEAMLPSVPQTPLCVATKSVQPQMLLACV